MSKLKWATGVAVLACSGALMACGDGSGTPAATGSATPSGSTTPSDAATPTATTAPDPTAPPASTSPTRPAGKPSATAGAGGVLSGKREVTIVRVQATESGVALDGGALVEVDDDSGRQLFVPTPAGDGKYLIKAYGRRDGHPANDDPACWQVVNPGDGTPLTVEGTACDPGKRTQLFSIVSKGKGAYAISNDSAFLQFSPSRGLILEELGDAPLRSTFKLVDNGPARTPAGG
ncbi:RICIN domain-containing protein [Micromonospora wenchangensis]|uniref:RICIN domain-containing protein n=1 Tax=Micromonospora wenchangensis TaxID=1185415 RepID=UPI003D75E02B